MAEAMKHNSPSSSHRVNKYEKEKTRILVPTQESGPNYALPGKERGGLYSRMQFHLVDLESDKVHLHCTPSLLQCAPLSSVVAVDNSVYIFGSRPFIPEYESESESETETETETQEPDRFMCLPQDKVFLGASRYDLSPDKFHQTNVWCPAPIPTRKRILPVCVTLSDKIYVFGSNYFEPEVLDPTVGQSKALDLPFELVGCKVSNYPLPDPPNRRILMHLSNGRLSSPTIYEFRLNDDDDSSVGKWKPIAVDFHDWTNVAAVVDNVIYFYSPNFPYLIRAFDLATGTWLKISWKSKFKKVRGLSRAINFDAMIPLGNRILCFIVWLHIPEKGITCWAKVYFFKFRVEQSGATVNLCPLKSYSYELPDTWQVQQFLPV